MPSFPPGPLLLALEALAETAEGLPAPTKFVEALLPRAQVAESGAAGCTSGLRQDAVLPVSISLLINPILASLP